MRVNPFPSLVAAAVALGLSTPALAKPKVYVAPYASVHHSLPAAFGVHTAGLIVHELKAQKKVAVVAGPPVTVTGASKPLDARAQARIIGRAEQTASRADDAMKGLRFKVAVKRYKKALSTYDANLVYLDDFSRLVDTRVDLAVALFRTGEENAGEHLLAEVIALDPNKKLDPSRYPPLFRRTFAGIKRKLLSLRRCSARVTSSPAGAEVYFDGRDVGKTPLVLTGMVRGLHYVKVVAAGAAPYAEKIHATPGRTAEVDAGLAGSITGPVATLVDGLAAGRIDRSVLRRLRSLASKAGADYAIIGGARRGSDTYAVRSWIYDVHHGKLAELPDMSFDPDMLGAAIEVYKTAAKIATDVHDFPEPVDLPVKIFSGGTAPSANLTRVNVGPAAAAPAATETVAAATPSPGPVAAASGPVAPSSGPVAPASGPVAPASGPVAPSSGPVAPSSGPVAPSSGPVAPSSGPVAPSSGPVAPSSGPVAPSSGPVAPSSGPVAPSSGPIAPARHHRSHGHPVITAGEVNVGSAGPSSGPVAPSDQSAGQDTGNGDSNAVVLGGPMARTLSPKEQVHPKKRYAAVDVNQVVAPSDELEQNPHHGWPWWAWGLLVVGVGAVGAGGYFAADKAGLLGGSAQSATVTVTWPN